jgi:cytochrome c biogenesis factor
VLILFSRYRQTIIEELNEFVSSKASLYFAVFLAVISIAFIAETDRLVVTVASAALTAIAVIVVFAFLIYRIKKSPKK